MDASKYEVAFIATVTNPDGTEKEIMERVEVPVAFFRIPELSSKMTNLALATAMMKTVEKMAKHAGEWKEYQDFLKNHHDSGNKSH